MALTKIRKKRDWNQLNSEEFHYINLIGHLQELKEYGFFIQENGFV